MPILEVIHAAPEPAAVGQKQAFVHEAVEIFREVLDTPDGRLRILFYSLGSRDSLSGLIEQDSGSAPESPA